MQRQIARVLSSKWLALPLVAAPFVYLAWTYQKGAVLPSEETNATSTMVQPLAPSQPFQLPQDANSSSESETEEDFLQGLTISDADFQAATNPEANPDAGHLLVLGEFFKDIGEIAIAFFIIVLCLTPLRRLLPRSLLVSALNKHRRLLGISCFFYASLHLAFYFVDRGWSKFVDEWYLPYILAGLVAFVVLLVMAATSTDWMVRRMGARRWKNLHRFVYLLIPLLFYHKGWVGKADWETVRETLFWFSPLFALQAARLLVYFRKRKSVPVVSGGA